MVVEIAVPELGDGVTEAQFVGWLFADGDVVNEGDEIAEVMTDKANVAIVSPRAGRLGSLAADVDDTVLVGQVIAIIDGAGA
jgi:pyruvate/2-oxoglutarate dehydrogenase complex dihydrolipoamide acyltransferase (E2) component